MAEEIVFKTRVDTGNTAKDIDGINKSLKGVDASSQKVGKDSAKALEELNKRIKDGGMSARQLQRAIQEYQTIALEAGRTSPVGQQAIKDAAVLQDQLTDLRNEINRTAHDGANMQAAMQLGSSVVAGYGAVKGSMTMLGIESESLQESFVKLQAATTTLNSLEAIRASLEKESFLMMKARTVATGAMTVATAAYNAVVGTSVGLMKAFKLALAATGIGAIVVGIGLLIANFEKLVGWLKSAVSWLGELVGGLKSVVSWFGEEEKAGVKAQDNLVKAVVRSQNRILQSKRHAVSQMIAENKRLQSSIEYTYNWEIEKAKAAGKNTKEIEEAKRNELRKTYESQIDLLEESMKLNTTNATQMVANMKRISEARAQLLKLDREDELQGIRDTAEARKKAADDREKWAQREEELAREKLERERLLKDFIIANIEDENIQRLTKLQEQHNRERDELIKKYGEDTELLKQLEIKQDNELQAVRDELKAKQDAKELEDRTKAQEQEFIDRKARLEGEMIAMREDWEARMELEAELAELEREIALNNTKLTEGEKFKIQEEYDQKIKDLNDERAQHEMDLNQQIADAQVEVQGMAFNAIGSLSNAFFDMKSANLEEGTKEELENAKKQFEINKALQITQAVISGVQGVQAAFSSGAAIPVIGAVMAPVYAALAAGVAVANVAQISSQKFNPRGSGGSRSVSAPTPASPTVGAPNMPDVGGGANTTMTGGLPEGGQGSNGVKVSVVDSDIKAGLDNQEKVSVISSFG